LWLIPCLYSPDLIHRQSTLGDFYSGASAGQLPMRLIILLV
jgi:hypothetical protein